MRVGVPLSRLSQPWSKHQAVLSYTEARLTLYVDGLLMDNDFPFGEPSGMIDKKALIVNKKAVGKWSLVQPALKTKRKNCLPRPLQRRGELPPIPQPLRRRGAY